MVGHLRFKCDIQWYGQTIWARKIRPESHNDNDDSSQSLSNESAIIFRVFFRNFFIAIPNWTKNIKKYYSLIFFSYLWKKKNWGRFALAEKISFFTLFFEKFTKFLFFNFFEIRDLAEIFEFLWVFVAEISLEF